MSEDTPIVYSEPRHGWYSQILYNKSPGYYICEGLDGEEIKCNYLTITPELFTHDKDALPDFVYKGKITKRIRTTNKVKRGWEKIWRGK